jgi:Phospholipase_D-nuclease N-terminal/Short C-terminal domain
VPIAADYPFLDIFWTMLVFFGWVIWFFILIRVLTDIFRRHDASGWVKAAWIIFVVFLPFLGVLVYLIANGSEMTQRDVQQAQASQQQFDEYVKDVAGSGGGGAAAEIEKANALRQSGAITDEEFQAIKRKALA